VDSPARLPHREAVTSASPVSTRRNDLDWLRIGAFGLLIVYHVGLAYGPYDWHVHSAHTLEWIREAVLVTNPWRLTLLFLVSGCAVRFMTDRKTPRQVARLRIARLGPPLIFGVLVLVSIQSWIEAMDKGGFSSGYLAWLWHEFSPRGLSNGVPLNHLWFVVYIAVYSFVVVGLLNRPAWIAAVDARIGPMLSGWRVLIIPVVYLIVIRVLLFPMFGITNYIFWDWYNHLLSLGAFLFGFFIVRQESIWRDLERFRWVGVAVGACALPVMMLQVWHPGGGAFLGAPRNLIVAIDQWAVISAMLGFASKYLRQTSGPVLRYLNDAVFTCYLAHQTILVVALWLIRPAGLSIWVEPPLLIAITLGGSLLIYEIVRRIPILRPIWGLRPLPAAPNPPLYRRRRLLLGVGALAPALAVSAVGIAILAYPGFDNASQYLSELGGASATNPMIFNVGVFIAALMAAVAGVGFGLAIVALSEARVTGGLTAVVFVLAAIGLALACVFPWPDPRHTAINLALGIQFAPLLLLWGLRGRKDFPLFKLFLIVVVVVMAALTLTTHHMVFPGTVNDANVGWWERAYALVLVAWVGIAAYVMGRRLRAHAHESESPVL